MTMDSRTRWFALVVLCLGDLMIVLDTTIVNVALPSIRQDLGFSETSLAWVVNAYLLTFGGFLLLGGRLGDLFGHRRLFLIGLTLFTAASVACGLSTSQEFLVGARAVQGLGGAIVSVVALSLIMMLFTEPAERAKAMGVIGFVAAGGGSVGVLLGGVLTDILNWHWIFLVNLPVGVAVFGLCIVLLPASRGPAVTRRLDVAGAVTVTAALMLAVYAIVNGNQAGWTSVQTIGLLAVTAGLLGLFLRIEARAEWPRDCLDCSCASRFVPSRRSCHLGSSDSATSPRRMWWACCGPPPCSPGSSCPPSTSSWCSVTNRWRSGWRSCPQT
jgi:MFS family permease